MFLDSTGLHIFLSHSSADSHAAIKICEQLEAAGFPVWIAPRNVTPGRVWADAIVEALHAAEAIVLLWTPSAEKSPHVMAELERAVSMRKVIIPLRTKEATGSEEVQFYVSRAHSIDLDLRCPDAIVDQITFAIRSIRNHLHSGTTSEIRAPRPTLPINNKAIRPTGSTFSSRFFALTASVTLLFAVVVFALMNRSQQSPTTRKKPIVIAIHPTDGFGKLRHDGLHAALDNYSSEVIVADIYVGTVQDMKLGKVDAIISKLKHLLYTENVLAVVGPPVTEATRPIIDVLASFRKGVPIIIESAGPPRLIGWEEHKGALPIFRLHSGIDSRGRNIADFIAESIQQGAKVTLLVERHAQGQPATYGDMLFDEVQRGLPKWDTYVSRNEVKTINFPTDSIAIAMNSFREAISSRGVVLMLGIGSHFKAVADEYFRIDNSNSEERAQFGGWMTSYAIADDIMEYRCDRIFEITDLDIQRTDVAGQMYGLFHSTFGDLTPAVRDQAFSFDAGLCILEAYRTAISRRFPNSLDVHTHPEIDSRFLAVFSDCIRCQRLNGVTGEIYLNQLGFAENSSRMIFCRYDIAATGWRPINYRDVLQAVRN